MKTIKRRSVKSQASKRNQLRLRLEHLEQRQLLAGDIGDAWSWFESYREGAVTEQVSTDSNFIGPSRADGIATETSQWIVQLTESAVTTADSIAATDALLDSEFANFEIVRGLGSRGLLLVEGNAPTEWDSRTSLESNPFVSSLSANGSVAGALVPNDPQFANLTGLNNVGQFGGTNNADVNAPEAWDITIGSTEVVVGIIDSGVDATHQDLYLNMWLNQGEIPDAKFNQLTDIDGDNLFTFYDLNDPVNASLSVDLNGNGYIDAIDLLDDPQWADGIDTDGNRFTDDFFGWNFRQNEGEPFAANNPSDQLSHGTHIAGTIGGLGNNNLGVTGLNWRSSIMSLKFLDQNNQGNVADAISAINYATMMKTDFDVNVAVTNNSWGQPGGASLALEDAIEASGDADILFVAAAGNGNILGNGVDNDDTPFFPASYDLDNVIAVAASDRNDSIARFSNFGQNSVDIVAPGVGIVSTLPGGRYGASNGTSMAAPHVAGTAALIAANLPGVTVGEVRNALLNSASAHQVATGQVTSGGRLDAFAALTDTGFAPRGELLPVMFTAQSEPDLISIESMDPVNLVVEYRDIVSVNAASIDNKDVLITFESTGETIVPESFSIDPATDSTLVTATYVVQPPGGSWDPLDFGTYTVSLGAGTIFNGGGVPAVARDLGSFQVRIENENSFIVTTTNDTNEANSTDQNPLDANGDISLRSAIDFANRDANPKFIFLDDGVYTLTLDDVANEAESNDTRAAAQNLESEQWTLVANPDIHESTTIPHVSIDGTGDGTVDVYQFEVPVGGGRGIFDIDFANRIGGGTTQLQLFDDSNNQIAVNTTNDGSTIPVEDSGTAISDSLIDFNFATGGTYFIQVHAQDGSAPA
ncbi:MAG: S8 family serine peptidase, partial [Rubripirellula sp.]